MATIKLLEEARRQYYELLEKCLYNGGIFDTKVSNGDGKKTITRRTGYKVYSANEVSKVTAHTYPVVDYFEIAKPIDFIGYNTYNIVPLSLNKFAIWNTQGGFNDTNAINALNMQAKLYTFWIGFAKGTTLEEAQKAIDGLVIQYELASKYQYDDEVIDGQPMHTLPQAGETWFDNEWRKGLNLCKIKNTSSTSLITVTDELPAGIYTLSLSGVGSGARYDVWGTDGTFFGHVQIGETEKITLNLTAPAAIRIALTEGIYSDSLSIMLTRGKIPYPYEDYHGGIVRQNEMPIYYTTDTASPAQTIGGIWEKIGDFTVGSTTVHAWKRI